MCGLSGARAGASGPGERGKRVRVDLPEGEDDGWGKGEVNEVSGRVEERSRSKQ